MSDELIRVLLVDDQPVVRRGFVAYLSDEPDIVVVGEAGDGEQALAKVAELQPDVVLMDARMPSMDGLTATRAITARPDAPAVVVVTTFDLDEYLYGALDAGACGFLLKDTDPEDLVAAVRAAASEDSLVSPSVTRRIVRELVRRGNESTTSTIVSDADPDVELTARESDILLALCDGLSNAEIAQRLFVEVSTVKTHLSRIGDKIGVRERVKMVVWAFRSGLVSH